MTVGGPVLMDRELSPARWLRLMAAWGFPRCEETLEALQRAYDEPGRHYHTGAHINACLALLDAHRELAHDFRVVELALWFHDAVYDPRASNHEARSASWATGFMQLHGAPEAAVNDVEGAILATRHDTEPESSDHALVVDLDLCILGSDEVTFAAFEDAIRAEYLWVPIAIFRDRRAEILEGFLRRASIYHHATIRERREERARANLTSTIATLRGRA